jgi:hypothetical protein
MPEDEQYCFVCKAQLHIGDAKLLEDEDDEIFELCPICKTNYISEDEDMCSLCRASKLKTVFVKEEEESEDTWRTYLDEEVPVEDEESPIPLDEIAEEEEEEEEWFEEEVTPADDFEDDYDLGDFEDTDEDDEADEADDDDEE